MDYNKETAGCSKEATNSSNENASCTPVGNVTLIVAVDRHERYCRFDDYADSPSSNLPKLLELMKDEGLSSPDAALIAGDYVGRFGGGGNFPFMLEDVQAEIDQVYGRGNVPGYFTYGSHDKLCYDSFVEHEDGSRDFHYICSGFFSGPAKRNGYYLYGISFSQVRFVDDEAAAASLNEMPGRGGRRRGPMPGAPADLPVYHYPGKGEADMQDPYGHSAEAASERFLAWVNSLEDHDPIVVGSHMPLHKNPKRKDNLGGGVWAKALNEAAKGHDIFVVWGHNHTAEEMYERGEERMASIDDRKIYLVRPGETMTVPTGKLTLLFGEDGSPVLDRMGRQEYEAGGEDLEIDFTYMNAGYLKLGYASSVTFSDEDGDGHFDRVELRRYSLHLENNRTDITDFGSSGYKSPFKAELRKFEG